MQQAHLHPSSPVAAPRRPGAGRARRWPSSGSPTKPINLIVPWAAGGSTDQVTRVTAAELEKVLGQKIVVVNQPGASGSIGTKSALGRAQGRLHLDRRRGAGPGRLPDAGHAGRRRSRTGTCSSTSPTSPVVGVNAATPYQNMHAAAGRDEGQAGRDQVATAGVTSGGHNAMELIVARHRRQVPPRHLRRRQPGGRGHGGRRDRRHHAARGRAGRHDPRQAHPPAGHGERQAAGARGLRHHRAASASSCPASRCRPTTSASSFPRACRPRWWRRCRRSGPTTSPRARR